MWRRAFSIAAILSVVFGMTTDGLWVRSTRFLDYVGWAHAGGRYVQVMARGGVVCVDVVSVCNADQPLRWRSVRVDDPEQFVTTFNGQTRSFERRAVAGVTVISAVTEFMPPPAASTVDFILDARWHEVRLPYFHVLVLWALVPLAWCAMTLRKWLRLRHRARLRLCLTCGYDLRMTPAGACPECGTVGK